MGSVSILSDQLNPLSLSVWPRFTTRSFMASPMMKGLTKRLRQVAARLGSLGAPSPARLMARTLKETKDESHYKGFC
jgi:hypothetical protein